jgi:hypothetical protein
VGPSRGDDGGGSSPFITPAAGFNAGVVVGVVVVVVVVVVIWWATTDRAHSGFAIVIAAKQQCVFGITCPKRSRARRHGYLWR